MAWYDKLFGNDPNDPNKVSGEELLGMVPSLLGAYESGRGRPIGGPLQLLGNVMAKQGEKRQAFGNEQASDMSQLQALTARFGQQDPNLLNANSPQMEALGNLIQTDPTAAQNQITQIYNEQSANEQAFKAQQLEKQKLTQQRPSFDKAGRAWRYNPVTDRSERSPADDIPGGGNDPKYFQGAWLKKYTAEHPDANSAELASAWSNVNTQKQLSLLNALPADMAKNMANKKFVDLSTGEMVSPDVYSQPIGTINKAIALRKYGIVTDKQAEALDTIARVGAELRGVAQVAPKVLTMGMKNQPFKTAAKVLANKFAIPFLAKVGNADDAQYESLREAMALEIQQILTNSTRPVALQEMGIVIPGVDPKTDMKTLDLHQLIGIIPTNNEASQTAWVKMQNIDRLIRTKKKDITGTAGHSFLEPRDLPNAEPEISEPEMPNMGDSAGEDVSY